MSTPDHAELWEAARGGDPQARLRLARADLEAGRTARGLKWLRAAMAGGCGEAALLLGREYRRGTRVNRDYAAARNALTRAAEAGEAAAALELAEMDLAGLGAGPDPQSARRWLRRAAAAGHPPALEALGFVHAMNGESERAAAARALAGDAGADPGDPDDFAWPEPDPAAFRRETLCARPSITAIRGFMTGRECDYVVARGADRLRPAQVADPATGAAVVGQVRTGSDTGFGPDCLDVVLRLLEQRIAAATGLPVEHGEPLVLLHYAPGQQYHDHVDYLGASEAESEREARFGGQRVMTFLVWLNDVRGGGETAFPRLGIEFRGRKGDALMFRNVTEAGEPDPDTLHHGAPPVSGEKWLLSKWIRQRPHPL